MTLIRSRELGDWHEKIPITPSELELIDAARPKMLNGLTGSVHEPSAPIVISGAGMERSVAATEDDDVTNLSSVNAAATAKTGTSLNVVWLPNRIEELFYDGVESDAWSVEAAATVESFRWGDDGNKFYVIDNGSDEVLQYNCTTAYDPRTASYSGNAEAIADTFPRGLVWNDDGTRFYVTGDTNESVVMYTLSTAWDLSTASPSTGLVLTTQDNAPRNIAWNSDGTKFFMLGGQNDSVYQYSCSTAWTPSTGTYDSVSVSVNTQESDPMDVTFNSTGTRMYIVGNGGIEINVYRLPTAFVLSGAAFDFSADLSDQVSSECRSIDFGFGGRKVYVVGAGAKVYEYHCTRAVKPAV